MRLCKAEMRRWRAVFNGLRLQTWRIATIAMIGIPVAAAAQDAPAPAPVTPPAAPLDAPAASSVMPAAPVTPIQPIDTPLTPPSSVAVTPANSPVGPADLTPWGMYLNADPVVKAVLIGLIIASIVTWTIWLAKTVELVAARRRVRAALNALSRVRTSAEGAEALADSSNEVRRFVDAAATELRLSAGVVETDGIKERVASRLERLEGSFARRISRGTGVLATIGATAPFVGLAGTVWGIMNSFIGISKSHTTNLAVVAPGIAEALLATACGLAAAIPAVVIYNVFARQITGYRALLGDASAEVMRLVSRDLDRPAGAAAPSSIRRPAAVSTAAE
jgi:biopolymer transport protein ExbB